MSESNSSIEVSESVLPNAMEVYYSQLLSLLGERENQPIFLNNTITTIDIQENAPFYTEGIFRQFADRVYSVSPHELTGVSSPIERFSYQYETAIELATFEIDSSISSDTISKINSLKREVKRVLKEKFDFEKNVMESLNEILKNENLEEDSVEYELRRVNFLETMLYSDQQKLITDEITDYERMIRVLRSSEYTPAQKKLILIMNELSESSKISRPKSPKFEVQFPGSNLITFTNPLYRVKSLFDISPDIYPMLDLTSFKSRPDNPRVIEIRKESTHSNKHNDTWGIRGKGSFKMLSVSVGGGGAGEGGSDYSKEFSQLKSIGIKFSDIDEVYINRGHWFDPTIFSEPELKPLFDKINSSAQLKSVAISLVIARGLTLSLEFDEKISDKNWSKEEIKGRGGVKIFGFKFGGSGDKSTEEWGVETNSDRKTVTFSDDSKTCRLVAVRIENIYHPPSLSDPEAVNLMADFKSGSISLFDFQKTINENNIKR